MRPLDPLHLPLSGTQLVEASAGTGKTHTITWLVLRLLLERQLALGEILVVTFTQAAAAELRTRIRRRLREAAQLLGGAKVDADPVLAGWLARRGQAAADAERIETALRSLDEAPIFTIHGFCHRVLEEHAFESGVRFELELVAEAGPLLLEIVQDFWARELYHAPPARVQYLAEHRTDVGSLCALARLVTDWPSMAVLPAIEATDPDRAIAEYLDARRLAAREWPAARPEVAELLRSSAALNRSDYRLSRVEQWLGELDVLFGEADPATVAASPHLMRFTPAGLAHGTKKGAIPPAHPFFTRCERLEQARKSATRELAAWRLALEQRLVGDVRRELGERKAALGVRSFADLLGEVARALQGPGGRELARRIRQRHPAALIDEFQDTDPVQYEIMSAVYADPSSVLLLIGDPKQAIYAFRGADVFTYLDAARRMGPESTWTLRANYRSDPGLVEAINAVFSGPAAPFLFDQIAYHPALARPGATDELVSSDEPLPALELLWVPREGRAGERGFITKRWAEAELPAWIAARVVDLLCSGAARGGHPLAPGDLAVLTRTNQQAAAVQRALDAVGVPSVLHAQASVLDSPEAREVAALLRALVTPTRASALRTALATSLFGLDGAELYALATDEAGWQRWVERFCGWHDHWLQRSFLSAFRRCLDDGRVVPRLLAAPGGERRLTNVLHLGELLHEAAAGNHWGMASLLRWFDDVRHDPGAREQVAADARQIRLETDEQAVELVTLHKSKGLEYPVVLCPYLWDGTLLRRPEKEFLRYHDRADGAALKLDLRDPGEKTDELALAEAEALAEQLRLVYVALTRARHQVTVFAGAFNSYATSALAYLVHHGGRPTAELAEHVRSLDDRGLMAELERVAERAPGRVRVSELRPPVARRWRRAAPAPAELSAPTPVRTLSLGWRSSSFTALVSRSTSASDALEAGGGRDEGWLGRGRQLSEDPPPESPVLLHALPRGAAVGTLVHSVLEQVDWRKPETLGSLVRTELGRRPDLGTLDAELLTRALRELLATPLGRDQAPTLGELAQEECLRELEFLLPVRGVDEAFTARRLAEAFQRCARPPVPREYAAELRALGFSPLLGYLRGFIDLVFVRDGRYYLADYKTNHLGPSATDYAPARLLGAMTEHHYLLQYHLYTVAVHRWLGRRLPNYRYDAHFGGIYYLFIRGMGPSYGPGHGVFFDRPSFELVRALERALDGSRSDS